MHDIYMQITFDNVADQPSVSIILPVYNCDRFITQTLSSIIGQSYENFEIIVIDDNSIDQTSKILEEYSELEPRIKIFRNKTNMGVIFSRNKALSHASGRFVAFIDSDDIWLPQKLEIQIYKMIQLDCAMSFTNYRQINHSGERISLLLRGPSRIGLNLNLMTRFIALSTVMVDLDKIGKLQFDTNNKFNFAEDILLWNKIMIENGSAARIDFDLVRYRLVAGSLSYNKFRNIKIIWLLYRQLNGLKILSTTTYFMFYVLFSIFKIIVFRPYFNNCSKT